MSHSCACAAVFRGCTVCLSLFCDLAGLVPVSNSTRRSVLMENSSTVTSNFRPDFVDSKTASGVWTQVPHLSPQMQLLAANSSTWGAAPLFCFSPLSMSPHKISYSSPISPGWHYSLEAIKKWLNKLRINTSVVNLFSHLGMSHNFKIIWLWKLLGFFFFFRTGLFRGLYSNYFDSLSRFIPYKVGQQNFFLSFNSIFQ